MNKIVCVGVEARTKLIKGADFLANAVKSTLGPFGSNCAMEKGNRITNDGVTIASEIWVKDEIENRGVTILRESAKKTNYEAGDGTTTAITLAQAILKEAVRSLPDGRKLVGTKTPIEVIRQIEREKNEVIEKLNAMATPIKTESELIASAKVAVEDEELGELIGKAQWELGKDGVLIAEETNDRKSSVEKVHGIRIDNGFGTSIAINNVEKQTLEVDQVKTILTNNTLTNFKPLETILNQLVQSGVRKIAIVARAFGEEAIKVCMENTKNGFFIYPINAPYEDQVEVMKDMQSVLGGRFINYEDGDLDAMQLSDVGFAERIVANRYSAIFTGKNDQNGKERVKSRVEELKKQINHEPSLFMKRNISKRIAQLESGFGIVKIGATSEIERSYKLDKAEDAVNAVRVALQEGTVKGGGLAFKEISESLPDNYILKKPLLSIYEQIMLTAPSGFEIASDVRDPVKVLRVALNNACSVAGTFATANIAIASERPKPKYMQEVEEHNE